MESPDRLRLGGLGVVGGPALVIKTVLSSPVILAIPTLLISLFMSTPGPPSTSLGPM